MRLDTILSNRVLGFSFALVLVSLLFIGQAQASYLQVQNDSTIQASNDSTQTCVGAAVCWYNITIPANISGRFNFSYDVHSSGPDASSYSRLYKNGIAYGANIQVFSTAWMFANDGFDTILNTTDTLQVRLDASASRTLTAKNFRLRYDYNSTNLTLTQFGRGGFSWQNNVTYDNTTYSNSSDAIILQKAVGDYYHYYPFDTLLSSNSSFPSFVYDENQTNSSIYLKKYGYPRTITTIVGQGVVLNNFSITGNNTGDYFISNNPYNYSNITIQMALKVFNYTNPSNMYIARAGGWRILIISDPTSPYYRKLVFWGQFTTTGQWVANSTSILPNTRYNISIFYNNSAIVNDPIIFINGTSETIVESQSPVGSLLVDRSDAYLGRTPAGTFDCECQFDEMYIFARNLTYQERIDIANNQHVATGNVSLVSQNLYSQGKYPFFVSVNATIPSGTSIDLYYNYSDGVIWSGEILLSTNVASNQRYLVNQSARNMTLTAVLHNTSGLTQSPQIVDMGIYTSNLPLFSQYWSSIHGFNNSNLTNVSAMTLVSFNITTLDTYDNIDWYVDGVLSQSGGTVLNKTFTIAPRQRNVSVAQGTTTRNWIVNITNYNYNGTTPINLARLLTPIKNQIQYIYGTNDYFFNYSLLGFTKNIALKNVSTDDLNQYNIDFWITPRDGNITLNISRNTSYKTIDIYINDSLYLTTNISGMNATEIKIIGLNPLNITHIKINSSEITGFNLNYITFLRPYPALYDGTNYFQIKKAAYEGGINNTPYGHLSGLMPYSAFYENNITLNQDLTEIVQHNFNSLSVPLQWGGLVYDIRPDIPNGTSNNLYNWESLMYLDYLVDNASSHGLYVTFWFNMWNLPGYPLNVTTVATDGYPCASCLVNSSEKDSIIQMISMVSNRYKNHTNIQFEIPIEMFDGGGKRYDASYYANTENKASFKNYTGIDKDLPHNSSYTCSEFISWDKWFLDSYYNLTDAIKPTLTANGQLLTLNIPEYFDQSGYVSNCQQIVGRLIPRSPKTDFMGFAYYPGTGLSGTPTDNLTLIDNILYRKSSRLKTFGSVDYMPEYGINHNMSYNTSPNDIIDLNLRKIIVNIRDIDYNDINVSFGMAGYNYWFWRSTSLCPDYNDECWGLKYKNDTFLPYSLNISSANVAFDIDTFAPISNLRTTSNTQEFNITTTKNYNSVIWYLNETIFQINSSAGTEANYTFTTGYNGNWTIIASAYDGIKTVNQTWDWAYDTIAPSNISNLQNSTNTTRINWTWTDPSDIDFDHVLIQLNNVSQTNVSAGTQYFLAEGLTPNTEYTISTRTVDATGNVNQTWVNQTTMTSIYTAIPPVPVWVSNTTGSYWVNHTWQAGAGNGTDSFNVSHNSTWTNGTVSTSLNASLNPLGWSNITVWAWNNTGFLSATSISNNSQAPDIPAVSNTTPQLSSVTNDTSGARSINISFSVNQSNAITWTKYGTTGSMNSKTSNQSSGSPRWDNITSLTNATTYYYSVWAANASNTSLASNSTIQNFMTLEDYVPPLFDSNSTPSVTNIANATSAKHSNITFTVNQSNAITRTCYSTTGSMATCTVNKTSGLDRFDNLTGLSNITIYYFTIRAWNSSNTSYYINTSIQSFITTEDYTPPETPGSPIINSNLNNITSTSATSFSVNVNNAVLFSAGANQSLATWTWTGATKLIGDGTTNTTAWKLFSNPGIQYVSVYGTNTNGTTQTLTWNVDVVTGGGDGGTDWDFLTGTVNVAGATITTNPNIGSTTGGAYSFGYVFVDGQTYWINVSKAGYDSNNTQITFNEDNEVWNPILTQIETIFNIKTLAATNIDTDSATLNANVTNHTGTDDIWFEYGSIDGIFHYKSDTQSITGNGTISLILDSGYPIIPDTTYYYRAAITNEKGNQMSFTTSDISSITGFDFDKNWQSLKDANFGVSNLTTTLPATYTDIIGVLFWGIIFSLIFMVGWIRQGDVTNMALLGILISGSILVFVPPEFMQIGQALLVISIAGMLVSYIYKK